jgi:hypothetical protein
VIQETVHPSHRQGARIGIGLRARLPLAAVQLGSDFAGAQAYIAGKANLGDWIELRAGPAKVAATKSPAVVTLASNGFRTPFVWVVPPQIPLT